MASEFKIYYGDGSTYDGEPRAAPPAYPRLGIQYIIGDDLEQGNQGLGMLTCFNNDIYIYSSDIGWHGTNKYADLMTHLDMGRVERVNPGLWIPRTVFLEIQKRATTDPDFNRKSANDPVREDGEE